MKKHKKLSKSKMKTKVKEQRRKQKKRELCQQMSSYMKMRRNFPKPKSVNEPEVTDQGTTTEKGLDLEAEVEFPDCDGVGHCCVDRPLSVEPGDVLRIIGNEAARERFGIKNTGDLYKTDTKSPLMLKFWDEKTGMPCCFVRPVPLTGERDGPTACPFYIHPRESSDGQTHECVLGEDRLTQCKPDPIMRVSRVDDGGRICGWSYTLSETKCMGCPKSKPSMRRVQSVESWMLNTKMLRENGRYAETDMYVLYSSWLKTLDANVPTKRMAMEFIFNWSMLTGESDGGQIGPQSVPDILMSARMMTERLVAEKWGSDFGEKKQEK